MWGAEIVPTGSRRPTPDAKNETGPKVPGGKGRLSASAVASRWLGCARRGEAMRALLVGIAPGSATIVAKALGVRGHEHAAAGDAVHALAVIRAESPELVVVEDALPDMAAA